jgi:putative Mn2+ efflux pump MntP
MDAFGVAMATGAAVKKVRLSHALIVGTWFGVFQAIMPLAGWFCGVTMKSAIHGVDHWIAFALLTFIGCKMIYESFKMESIEDKPDPMNPRVLFVLAVATSIDALAVGVSFAMLAVPIAGPAVIIGVTAFLISALGVWIGDKLGRLFEKRVEIFGGIVLIAIGFKILISHLTA